jgi:exodeoxyribonuclease VII small subunit
MSTDSSFEASYKELEKIVEQLEAGDLPLERSLELYEQGVRLWRQCHKRLDDAEHRVEVLLKGADGNLTTAPFEEPES